ncbi:hypothetical protein [Streptomyces monomycini]|uniref:hypothetical protein n=1 Tax=Streptomyces monomycini TaxID=371720 RepID=UPI0004AB747F|nr:hypothetical protein [Streptomyces monomycini]
MDVRQAKVNAKEAEAVSSLLSVLSEAQFTCIQIGPIFPVKHGSEGNQVIAVRNLTQLEMRALSRCPEIQTRPEKALGALATAISAMADAGDGGDDDDGGDAMPRRAV